jgi:hypothetical protein
LNAQDRIKHIGNWKVSFEIQASLTGFYISEVSYKNDIFPAISNKINSHVNGIFIEFVCDYKQTYELYKSLDDYEMEGVLYKREWIEVVLNNSKKKSCWTYIKI